MDSKMKDACKVVGCGGMLLLWHILLLLLCIGILSVIIMALS